MQKQIVCFFMSLTIVTLAQNENDPSSNFNNFDNFRSWNFEVLLTNQLNYQPVIGETISYFGIGGYPRYNFFEPKDYFSLGIGTPFNVGFDGYGSGNTFYYQYFIDLPLELSINIGDKATDFAEYWVGTSLGFGFDYNYSVYYNNSIGILKTASNSFGPSVSLCFKYRYREMPVGIRVGYMLGIINDFEKDPYVIYDNNSEIPKIITLSIAYGVL